VSKGTVKLTLKSLHSICTMLLRMFLTVSQNYFRGIQRFVFSVKGIFFFQERTELYTGL